MYNVDLKNTRKNYIFGFSFFIIGLIIFLGFLIFPLIMLNNKNNYDSENTAIKVEYDSHKDSDGNRMYSPIYYFEINDIEYVCRTNSSSSSKNANIGDLIYYNKSNPTDCMPEYEIDMANMFLIFSIIPLIFVIIGLVFIFNTRKKINKIKYLADNGTLIKNLPYTMVNSNVTVNSVRLQSIAVNYTFPDGTTKQLIGNPRYDHKTRDEDQLIDLLIDPIDPNNYYIDFNIEPK